MASVVHFNIFDCHVAVQSIATMWRHRREPSGAKARLVLRQSRTRLHGDRTRYDTVSLIHPRDLKTASTQTVHRRVVVE